MNMTAWTTQRQFLRDGENLWSPAHIDWATPAPYGQPRPQSGEIGYLMKMNLVQKLFAVNMWVERRRYFKTQKRRSIWDWRKPRDPQRERVVYTTTARTVYRQNTRRVTAGLNRRRSIHNDVTSSQICWILCMLVASLKVLPGFDSRYRQNVSLLDSVQTGSGAQPVSHTMGTGTSVSGVERKGSEADH
jgi:hypothetical protein